MCNVNTVIVEKPVFLTDKSSAGLLRPWKLHKRQSELLAESFMHLGLKKAERVRGCGEFLKFMECTCGHEKKLYHAWFCKGRLCPMCAWRRSLVMFHQLNRVLHTAQERQKLRFLFLTLTSKTVRGPDLAYELIRYTESWSRFSKLRMFQRNVVGWFRSLEITHDMKTDMYHPHFHVLIAVKPSYFKSGNYIAHDKWCEMWQRSMKLDYKPVVDVRLVKPKREGQTVEAAVAESAKYAVKPGDIFRETDKDGMYRAIKTLDKALHKKILIAFGGVFKKLRRELKLKDIENADLVRIDDEQEPCKCSICNSDLMETVYRWHSVYRDYVRIADIPREGVNEETGEIIFKNDVHR